MICLKVHGGDLEDLLTVVLFEALFQELVMGHSYLLEKQDKLDDVVWGRMHGHAAEHLDLHLDDVAEGQLAGTFLKADVGMPWIVADDKDRSAGVLQRIEYFAEIDARGFAFIWRSLVVEQLHAAYEQIVAETFVDPHHYFLLGFSMHMHAGPEGGVRSFGYGILPRFVSYPFQIHAVHVCVLSLIMLVFCKFLEGMSLQSKEVVVHLGQELRRYVFPVGVGQDGVDALWLGGSPRFLHTTHPNYCFHRTWCQ